MPMYNSLVGLAEAIWDELLHTEVCELIKHFLSFFSAAQSLISHTDTEHIPEVLFDLILHEVSHALGFSSFQFEK